jgi:hypothetical protein
MKVERLAPESNGGRWRLMVGRVREHDGIIYEPEVLWRPRFVRGMAT